MSWRIKPIFRTLIHTPDVVEFRWGVWNPTSVTLTDETESGMLAKLVPLFDGRGIPDIATAAGVAESEVESVLTSLRELDIVEETPSSALDYYIAQTQMTLGLADHTVDDARTKVLIYSDGFLGSAVSADLHATPQFEVELLESSDERFRTLATGINWADPIGVNRLIADWEDRVRSFVVVVMTNPNPILLGNINRLFSRLRLPWLVGCVDGPFLFVGPLVVPGRSSCWECFESRVWLNMTQATGYEAYKRALLRRSTDVDFEEFVPVPRPLASVLSGFTAHEVLNFCLTGSSFCIGKVLAIYVPMMEMSFNEVLRVPGCPGCIATAQAAATQLYFDVRSLLNEQALLRSQPSEDTEL